MSITIAVDVAKSIFEVAVSDRPGRIVKRARISRRQFTRLLATHPPATVLKAPDELALELRLGLVSLGDDRVRDVLGDDRALEAVPAEVRSPLRVRGTERPRSGVIMSAHAEKGR